MQALRAIAGSASGEWVKLYAGIGSRERGGTLHALNVARAHQIPTQIVDKPFDLQELVRYVIPTA